MDAFDQGREAQKEGKSFFDDNPYARPSTKWLEWRNGYIAQNYHQQLAIESLSEYEALKRKANNG